jgi:hypothetical protein
MMRIICICDVAKRRGAVPSSGHSVGRGEARLPWTAIFSIFSEKKRRSGVRFRNFTLIICENQKAIPIRNSKAQPLLHCNQRVYSVPQRRGLFGIGCLYRQKTLKFT